MSSIKDKIRKKIKYDAENWVYSIKEVEALKTLILFVDILNSQSVNKNLKHDLLRLLKSKQKLTKFIKINFLTQHYSQLLSSICYFQELQERKFAVDYYLIECCGSRQDLRFFENHLNKILKNKSETLLNSHYQLIKNILLPQIIQLRLLESYGIKLYG